MADEKDNVRDPSEEGEHKSVDDLKMSRTEEPEYVVNFEKLRDIVVFDGMGNKIKFGDIYKMQKTIIVFVRVNFVATFKSIFVLFKCKILLLYILFKILCLLFHLNSHSTACFKIISNLIACDIII